MYRQKNTSCPFGSETGRNSVYVCVCVCVCARACARMRCVPASRIEELITRRRWPSRLKRAPFPRSSPLQSLRSNTSIPRGGLPFNDALISERPQSGTCCRRSIWRSRFLVGCLLIAHFLYRNQKKEGDGYPILPPCESSLCPRSSSECSSAVVEKT